MSTISRFLDRKLASQAPLSGLAKRQLPRTLGEIKSRKQCTINKLDNIKNMRYMIISKRGMYEY